MVTTLGGSLAARFSDPVEEPELPPTDDTFFLADIVGNATFSFGVPKDLKWPAFANSPATQFTLSIVDTEDGSFLYNIFVTGGRGVVRCRQRERWVRRLHGGGAGCT